MVKRTFKAINSRAVLEPQTISNYDSRKESARFHYNPFFWISSELCYSKIYRISGRVVPGSSSGPRKLLSIEEEEDLVVFLRRCAMFGYPKSRKELMELVQRILEGKGIEYQIQMDGGEHFVKGILTLHYVHLQHYHKTEY